MNSSEVGRGTRPALAGGMAGATGEVPDVLWLLAKYFEVLDDLGAEFGQCLHVREARFGLNCGSSLYDSLCAADQITVRSEDIPLADVIARVPDNPES